MELQLMQQKGEGSAISIRTSKVIKLNMNEITSLTKLDSTTSQPFSTLNAPRPFTQHTTRNACKQIERPSSISAALFTHNMTSIVEVRLT
eukprot:scaffold249330_cov73-Cyclotella_meneghiniana.AAC.13